MRVPGLADPCPGTADRRRPLRPSPHLSVAPRGATAQAADRWAWKIHREPAVGGRPGAFVVHVWDCEEAPADGAELTVLDALDVLRRPGAVACPECQADIAFGPLT
ncbi:DUF6233 domain-containing protein [Streptomyces sp. SA15]|uniref:DUF6233 domain-containing protein n=1 Tax=Streptomyces sp. SA15 TaxID=934019 RepID=UPI00211BB542|nr:DUF6233 domain-containing protein [Streptomyces sp. SA15]